MTERDSATPSQVPRSSLIASLRIIQMSYRSEKDGCFLQFRSNFRDLKIHFLKFITIDFSSFRAVDSFPFRGTSIGCANRNTSLVPRPNSYNPRCGYVLSTVDFPAFLPMRLSITTPSLGFEMPLMCSSRTPPSKGRTYVEQDQTQIVRLGIEHVGVDLNCPILHRA